MSSKIPYRKATQNQKGEIKLGPYTSIPKETIKSFMENEDNFYDIKSIFYTANLPIFHKQKLIDNYGFNDGFFYFGKKIPKMANGNHLNK